MVFFAVDLHGCRRYPLVRGAQGYDPGVGGHQFDEMAAADSYMPLHSLAKPENGGLFVGENQPFVAVLEAPGDPEDPGDPGDPLQIDAYPDFVDFMGFAEYELAADTTTPDVPDAPQPSSTQDMTYEQDFSEASGQSLLPEAEAVEALTMNVHPWCMLSSPWYVQPAALDVNATDDVLEASADSSSLAVMTPVQPVSSSTAAAESETDCWACGRSFMNRHSLARHKRAMHGPRVWHVCDVCGKALATRQSLAAHALIHSGHRPFSCTLCGAGFLRRNSLRHHLFVKHGGEDANGEVKDMVVQQDPIVGVQVVHQRVSNDGGGIVFQRAAGGGVVGVLTTAASPLHTADTPHHGEDLHRQDDDGGDVRGKDDGDDGHFLDSPGIVMRLVRCGDPDVWRIEDLWQGPGPEPESEGASGAEAARGSEG